MCETPWENQTPLEYVGFPRGNHGPVGCVGSHGIIRIPRDNYDPMGYVGSDGICGIPRDGYVLMGIPWDIP